MDLLHLFIISSIAILILLNIYEKFKPPTIENFDNQTDKQNNSYQDYSELQNKDPMFLAIKNAANISYMKSQLDELSGIKQQILDLSNNVYTNAQQIDQIQQAVQDQAEAVTGGALQSNEEDDQLMDEPENADEQNDLQ